MPPVKLSSIKALPFEVILYSILKLSEEPLVLSKVPAHFPSRDFSIVKSSAGIGSKTGFIPAVQIEVYKNNTLNKANIFFMINLFS